MANHKSALKRHRQSEQRAARNRPVRSHVRTLVKNVRSAIEGQNVDEARTGLASATKALDKAAAKGVIHRNAAARRVSRLASQVAKLGS